ncbi:MAG: hypothetical protein ACXW15_07300 [Acidimicrobiia bacterium]
MGNVDGGHEVFALLNQPRKLFNSLASTDDTGLVVAQGSGRFHL